nr:polysaccharide biosynthesis tyrosine autokinase [Sulfitobacter sp. BSw21498]
MMNQSQSNFSGPRDEDDDTIDLGALIGTLWRGKLIIAAVTLIFMLLAGYYAYGIAVPTYRSTAVVVLETKEDSIVDLQSVVGGFSGDSTEINTEIEVLRSRGLAGKVVDRLDLVNDPEFNGRLREPSMIRGIISSLRSTLTFRKSKAEPQHESDFQKMRIRDGVVQSLLSRVSISNIRQSLVFNVTVETESPTKSAQIANTLAELYILNQIEVKFEATEKATEWLSNRVSELQIELENAEKKVSEFTARTQLVSIEGLQALERQIKELRDRIEGAALSRQALEARLANLEAAQTPAEKRDAAQDAALTRIFSNGLSSATNQTAFDLRFETVLGRVRSDLARSSQQLEALRTSETELAAQLASQGQDLIALQQLTRESEATRLLYEYFLTRLKETSAQEGIQKADSRMLSSAVIPGGPSAPKKSRIVAMAIVLGAMVGSGLVLLREFRTRTFRTATELEHHTGYTVIGQIPLIPARDRKNTLKYLEDKPTSAAAEAIRNLRTSLMLSNLDKKPQVIVSTSSIPGEGKTTVSLSLAKFLSGLGKSVLLVEGDIRRRTLHEYFPDMPRNGIASVLNGDVKFADAIHRPDGFGADVLGGEKTNVNAADIFSSDRFKAFISEMRDQYDFIIIDTPPVLVVPDARIISQNADAILFSVKWDSTNKGLVEESMRFFHNSNQRITGLVLSQIDEKGMKRYGYGGEYGAYGSYGKGYYDS